LGGDFQFGNGGLYTFTFSSVDDFDSYPLRFANNELYPSFIQLLEPDSIDELERSVSFIIENNTPDIRYYSGGEFVEGGTIAFVPRELWVDGPYISLLASGPTSTNSLDLNERGSYFATTPLKDGGLVAIWEDSPLSNGDIVYQRFSADGYPVGDRVIVANDWDTHVASITELSSGNLVITYQDYQSGYRKAVYKIFDANDQVVTSGIASQIDVDDYVEVRSFELDSGQFVVVSNHPTHHFTRFDLAIVDVTYVHTQRTGKPASTLGFK